MYLLIDEWYVAPNSLEDIVSEAYLVGRPLLRTRIMFIHNLSISVSTPNLNLKDHPSHLHPSSIS